MGIVKKNLNDYDNFNKMQQVVISKLLEYDFDIADLRLIEDIDQLVITLPGIVMFIDSHDAAISFEIDKTPDFVSNLILILTEVLPSNKIHITDSFVITENIKGKKIAVFGNDAKEIYKKDMVQDSARYYRILTSPSVKFYNC